MKFVATVISSLLLFATQAASSAGSVDGSSETMAPGTGFNIRDASGTPGLRAFVSSYSGGNDAWFDVPTSFDNPATAHWSRNGWEVVGFQIVDAPDEQRGWYLYNGGQTVNLTFYGFNQDIGLTRSGS